MHSFDIHETVPTGIVEGHCEVEWRPLLDAFLENFETRGEVGASLCVHLGKRSVIDVWGGACAPQQNKPWSRDTKVVVFSATKGATATCAHLLVDRGLLDLYARVSDYWPEFAQNGKGEATVAMMLNHTIGVPGFSEKIRPGGFADWDYMIGRLEAEAPFWQPGSACGYHMLTIGWLVGEVVRRISGKSLGRFFQDEIAKRLDLDFWIGLPAEREGEVSNFIPYAFPADDPLVTDLRQSVLRDQTTDAAKVVMNNGGYDPTRFDKTLKCYVPDSRQAHASEIGGAGGITNARGLAGLYAPMASLDEDFISPDHVWRMSQTAAVSASDRTLLMPTRFALGYMKSMDNRHRRLGAIESVILGDRAFGHVGAGGSLGFADPDCGLSFGYAMNKMGAGILLNERGQSLVDSAYRILGYRSNASGVWVR